ncbi:hypothetical protein BESB_003100 [Besnoitia besnoiti]|uniref:Transmembrane protein n=1 Tax=Besnoitia besnoiti TaxID=94643 RepID=A0A2A9MJ80_BESBE|nr:hypothetical protein BESB_003100 [Besnoitia besnoiti]PFH37969.1 hypothetical protein BESB_003100 [Besnoitia besnoiti]
MSGGGLPRVLVSRCLECATPYPCPFPFWWRLKIPSLAPGIPRGKTAKSVGFQDPTTLRLFHIGYVLGVIYGFLFSLILTARENYYSDASLISSIVLGVIITVHGLRSRDAFAVHQQLR